MPNTFICLTKCKQLFLGNYARKFLESLVPCSCEQCLRRTFYFEYLGIDQKILNEQNYREMAREMVVPLTELEFTSQ